MLYNLTEISTYPIDANTLEYDSSGASLPIQTIAALSLNVPLFDDKIYLYSFTKTDNLISILFTNSNDLICLIGTYTFDECSGYKSLNLESQLAGYSGRIVFSPKITGLDNFRLLWNKDKPEVSRRSIFIEKAPGVLSMKALNKAGIVDKGFITFVFDSNFDIDTSSDSEILVGLSAAVRNVFLSDCDAMTSCKDTTLRYINNIPGIKAHEDDEYTTFTIKFE